MVKIVFTLAFVLLVATGTGVLANTVKMVDALGIPVEQYGLLTKPFLEGSMIYVPDIMLGRAVESLMEERGSGSPFVHVKSMLEKFDVTVGNFEASVPEVHRKTKINGLQFSVKKEYLSELKSAGLDVLSLANNHSFDFGTMGYTHTLSACAEYELTCVGTALGPTIDSISYHTVGDTKVTTLMLNASSDAIDRESIAHIVRHMNDTSDQQIVFVHWGEEYALMHSNTQKQLAHHLIDSGIDAIIGHHPHVTQDIEEYQGKPIFYSLGNFIFDQYWDEKVQEGYAVGISFVKRNVTYTLYPFRMKERSIPEFLDAEERRVFFSNYIPHGSFADGEESYAR